MTPEIRLTRQDDHHKFVSAVKSGLRIVTCMTAIMFNSVFVLALGLAFAEVLGIYEEFEA